MLREARRGRRPHAAGDQARGGPNREAGAASPPTRRAEWLPSSRASSPERSRPAIGRVWRSLALQALLAIHAKPVLEAGPLRSRWRTAARRRSLNGRRRGPNPRRQGGSPSSNRNGMAAAEAGEDGALVPDRLVQHRRHASSPRRFRVFGQRRPEQTPARPWPDHGHASETTSRSCRGPPASYVAERQPRVRLSGLLSVSDSQRDASVVKSTNYELNRTSGNSAGSLASKYTNNG